MSYQIRQPFAQFFGLDGKPLEGGFIYFGEVNKNPQTDPIMVYSDDGLTQPVAQPLRTSGGYVSLNGKPIQVFTADTAMSVSCYGSDRGLVFYLPEAAGGESALQFIADLANDSDPAKGAALVGFRGRTAHDKLSERISVKDFGAVGDGVTDDTAAFQAAIDYAVDSTPQLTFGQNWSATVYNKSFAKMVRVPAGQYLISSTLVALGALYMEGDGDQASVIVQAPAFSGDEILAIGFTVGTTVPELFWTWGGRVANIKIVGNGNTKTGIFSWRQHTYSFENVRVSQCAVGFWLEGGYTGQLHNCTAMKNTVGVRASLANAPSPIYEEPNDITFLRCNIFHNTTGYEFDNSTNINIIGGVIQDQTGAGINCTGLVRQLYMAGVYWELNNLSNAASAYIIGQIRIITASGNFINLGAKRFIDATNVTVAAIKDNELYSDGTVIYIPPGAAIQRLEYRNNRPIFSLNITQRIIDNQKAGFCPLPVEFDDFRSASGIGFSEQLKRAFNGSAGEVAFTQDVDVRWTVDFPCKITSTSKDVGISSTVSGSVALTINSSDVTVDGAKVRSTGNANAISIGAAAAVARVDVNNCKLIVDTPTTGAINVGSTSSSCRLTNNTWVRQGGGGRSVTVDGDNCAIIANVTAGSATEVYLGATSSGCKVVALGETVTNAGTGNAVL